MTHAKLQNPPTNNRPEHACDYGLIVDNHKKLLTLYDLKYGAEWYN